MMASARSGMLPAALLATTLSGCAGSVPPEGGFAEVERILAERVPQHRVVWNRDSGEDAAVQAAVQSLLADELTADEVVQVALLNNRGLQATYEDLGVGQAELVQAGLLSNPVFSASVRWTTNPSEGLNLGFGIVQSFLDLLMLPARKRLAAAEFEEAQRRVAAEVLNLAAETRAAYYAYQAAEQSVRVLHEVAAAAQASYDLARRMEEAGNISERGLAAEQASLEQAKVELAGAEADAHLERERLTRLMGLWGQAAARWTVPDGLPELPPDDLPFERLESLAIAGNLELAAARAETKALAGALGMARSYGWLDEVELGVEYEREADDQELLGPTLALGLPIFDQGRPQVARAAALLRQSEHRLEQQAIELRSEVRAVRDRLIRLRDRAEHYRQVVVPLSQRLVELSLQEYNYMLIGPFEVLAAKQNEIAAYRRYIETIRDWWITHAELERLLGRQLGPDHPPAAADQRPAVPPQPDLSHADGGTS